MEAIDYTEEGGLKIIHFVKTDKGVFALSEQGYLEFNKQDIIKECVKSLSLDEYTSFMKTSNAWVEVKEKINYVLEKKN